MCNKAWQTTITQNAQLKDKLAF